MCVGGSSVQSSFRDRVMWDQPTAAKPIFHFCEAVRLCRAGVSAFKVVVILLSVMQLIRG